MWIVGGFLALLAIAALALWIALRDNSVRVLDRVDRVTGGSRDVALVEQASLGPDPLSKIALYRHSEAAEPLPVVLFVHGGSWVWGSPDDYGFVARSIAPQGYLVALSGYRLGEAGKFPAMLEDTAAAVRWLRDNAARHGGDPERIWLVGHSAGAYNVVQVALEKRWLNEAGVPQDAIAGVIGLSGPYDFLPLDSDATKLVFGSAEDLPATQPINHVRGDAPPLYLLTGEQDTTVRPRNTRVLGKAVAEAGGAVVTRFYPTLNHSHPVIHLATPWRGRNPAFGDDILAILSGEIEASVPVQRNSR